MKMPSVREMFVPDPGYYIADVDLDRADLQVVVWEADDADLKRQLHLGVDIHIINGCGLGGKEPPPEDELIESHPEFPEHLRRYSYWRQFAKNFVHGTNYGGKERTMAKVCGITVAHAEALQRRWFELHPGILKWHERVEADITSTRTVRNAFGFHRIYFDRIESVFTEALAWIPQSTVAIVINKGLLNLCNNLPQVQPLIQVHDSVVMQWPQSLDPGIRAKVREQMLIPVPYDDPLTIPVGLKLSAESWGKCKGAKWVVQ